MTTIKEEFTPEELKRIQELEFDALKEIDRICRKYNLDYSLTGGTLLGAIRHKGFIPWDDDIDIAMPRDEYDKLWEICRKELDSKFFLQSHDTEKNWYRLYSKIRVNDTLFKELAHSEQDIHHGIYIDIFPLDNVPNNKVLKTIQKMRFGFYKLGLSVKYINPNYRKGIKRIVAFLLKLAYCPFRISFLYEKADKCLKAYNNTDCLRVINYNGAYGDREIFPREYFNETIDLRFEDAFFKCSKYYDQILTQLYGDYMTLPPVEKRRSLHTVVSYRF